LPGEASLLAVLCGALALATVQDSHTGLDARRIALVAAVRALAHGVPADVHALTELLIAAARQGLDSRWLQCPDEHHGDDDYFQHGKHSGLHFVFLLESIGFFLPMIARAAITPALAWPCAESQAGHNLYGTQPQACRQGQSTAKHALMQPWLFGPQRLQHWVIAFVQRLSACKLHVCCPYA
jgi:nitroreductase